jgi:hypothetical protein
MGYRTGEARSIPHFPDFLPFNCVTPSLINISEVKIMHKMNVFHFIRPQH